MFGDLNKRACHSISGTHYYLNRSALTPHSYLQNFLINALVCQQYSLFYILFHFSAHNFVCVRLCPTTAASGSGFGNLVQVCCAVSACGAVVRCFIQLFRVELSCKRYYTYVYRFLLFHSFLLIYFTCFCKGCASLVFS